MILVEALAEHRIGAASLVEGHEGEASVIRQRPAGPDPAIVQATTALCWSARDDHTVDPGAWTWSHLE